MSHGLVRQAYARYLTNVKYSVRSTYSPLLSKRESKLPIKLAEEWGGYRRGKPAALQRAGVPLLKITNFKPKLHSWADLFRKTVLNPRGFIKF